MAQRVKVEYDEFVYAVQQLQARGDPVTVASLRKLLDGGSNTTLTDYIRKYKLEKDVTGDTCYKCVYFLRNQSYAGVCRRYPQYEKKAVQDSCGEFTCVKDVAPFDSNFKKPEWVL